MSKILILVFLLVLFPVLFASRIFAFQPRLPDHIRVIIGEAANQGYDGMLAVAEVIRNRGGSLKGFSSLKRKNLDMWIDRQGQHIINQAIQAWKDSEHSNTVKDATHFENVEAFGFPWWTKDMVITAKIKDHTFFAPGVRHVK